MVYPPTVNNYKTGWSIKKQQFTDGGRKKGNRRIHFQEMGNAQGEICIPLGMLSAFSKTEYRKIQPKKAVSHWPKFSCSVVSNSPWPLEEHARLPCPSLSPRVCSNSCPLSWWYHPTISSFVALDLSQHQDLFQWVGSSHRLAKVVEFQPQHQSFQWIFRVDFF